MLSIGVNSATGQIGKARGLSLFYNCGELFIINHHHAVEGSDVQTSPSEDNDQSIVPVNSTQDVAGSLQCPTRVNITRTETSANSGRSNATAKTCSTTTSSALSCIPPWDENCFHLPPPYVKSIGVETFAGCHKLQSILLPPTLQSIGNYAFDGCHRLEEITLPGSTKHIGDGCFLGCE